MYLFDLASRHMTWLSARQSVTAANIANADTPGYRARDIAPFGDTLESLGSSALTVTSPAHQTIPDTYAFEAASRPVDGWGMSHSGNSVTLEKELMSASSANRMLNLDASISRSFHRMILTSLKV